jgi:hypothetical protein
LATHTHKQINNVNNDDNDRVDSVMTEDLVPLTQLVAVAKSVVQPAENMAVPSCSAAQPGLIYIGKERNY